MKIVGYFFSMLIGAIATWYLITTADNANINRNLIISISIVSLISSIIFFLMRRTITTKIDDNIEIYFSSLRSKINKKYIFIIDIIEDFLNPIKNYIKIIVLYLGITATIGFLVAISANLLLIASLTTQQIQIKTLKEQNKKLESQNTLIANSTKIQSVIYYRDQIDKLNGYIAQLQAITSGLENSKDGGSSSWGLYFANRQKLEKDSREQSSEEKLSDSEKALSDLFDGNYCQEYDVFAFVNCNELDNIKVADIGKLLLCSRDGSSNKIQFLDDDEMIKCIFRITESDNAILKSFINVLESASNKIARIDAINNSMNIYTRIKSNNNPYELAECKIDNKQRGDILNGWKLEIEFIRQLSETYSFMNSMAAEDKGYMTGGHIGKRLSGVVLETPRGLKISSLRDIFQILHIENGDLYKNLANSSKKCIKVRDAMSEEISRISDIDLKMFKVN